MKLTAPHLARSAGQQRHLGDVREAIRHPEKTLTKAVDNVLARFYHDAKETSAHVG